MQARIGLLKRGPKWTPESTPETQKLQEGHMANINKMSRMGKLMAAGPFAGKSDLLGNFIIAANSPEEAKVLAEADPRVKAGQLSVEIHPWWSAKEVWP